MTEWKKVNIGCDLANNINMEEGPIVNGSYNGFSLFLSPPPPNEM